MASKAVPLTESALFSLPNREFIRTTQNALPGALANITHEGLLLDMQRRMNHEERAKWRKQELEEVRPRNDKMLELVDHVFLLEDEVLEMNREALGLLAYVRGCVVSEEKERLRLFMSWTDTGVEEKDSENQGKESSHGEHVEGDLELVPSIPATVDFSLDFDRQEAVMLTKVLNEEAALLLIELSSAYEAFRLALMEGGMLTVLKISGNLQNNSTFVHYAICNVRIAQNLAEVLDATKGKGKQVDNTTAIYEENIFEAMTRQALNDMRTMCGYPKHSRDPKYLNEDSRRQLENARVQRRLRVAFRLDELRRAGLWLGKGYQEGDYVEPERKGISITQERMMRAVAAGKLVLVVEPGFNSVSGERELQVNQMTAEGKVPWPAQSKEPAHTKGTPGLDVHTSNSEAILSTKSKVSKYMRWKSKLFKK